MPPKGVTRGVGEGLHLETVMNRTRMHTSFSYPCLTLSVEGVGLYRCLVLVRHLPPRQLQAVHLPHEENDANRHEDQPARKQSRGLGCSNPMPSPLIRKPAAHHNRATGSVPKS